MDYNKLLEKARKVYAECVTNAEKRKLESVFPELAESEDEKIRKEILEYIDKATGCKEWVAWLEKQGEHKKFRDSIQVGDKVTRNEDGMLVNFSQLNRVAKKNEKQGEQKSVLPGFEEQEGVAGRDYIPVEWVEAIENYGKWKIVKVNEQKPTWNDEDEKILGKCIDAASGYYSPEDKQSMKNWLKSLKPQPHWKPTEEQIEAVKRAAKDVFEFSSRSEDLRLKNEPYFKSLYSLYEQLKKL